MTNQKNRVHAHVNSNDWSVATRVRDFVRMNPSESLGSQANKDPQNFMDEIKKIFEVMKFIRNDRVELASSSWTMFLISGTLSGRRIGMQMQLLSLGFAVVRLFSTGFSE